MKQKTKKYLISLLEGRKAYCEVKIAEKRKWLDFHAKEEADGRYQMIYNELFSDCERRTEESIELRENEIIELEAMIQEVRNTK